MTSKCKCGRFVSSTEGARCKKCGSIFHRDCVNLSPNSPIPAKWVCDACHKGISKSSTTKVPSAPASSAAAAASVVPAAVIACLQDDPSTSIVTELRLLRSEMASFRGEITQLNATLSEFYSRVDNIETRLSRLEEQSSSRESSENSSVQATILQLQSQLNDRDQDLLMNDIEISGLQENNGENLISITCLLAKKLGVDLDGHDVVSAVRLGLPRRVSTVGASDGERAPRPRPLVVRLTRRALRDDLLRGARVRRGADTSGIINAEPRRFYVNEHLTRTNRILFLKARQEGRNKNWKFVWTKGGRIYIRKTSTAPVHRVRSEVDIERFFSSESF